ncbi:uncharacterized protein LAJ45_07437 [Morchella importuna]|uniref:uncharacterized protein n=1 Tax=Morchella importuna TaxID=1174673 RepID=UPI001E8EB939|nr:uncharacterized protein LAJ45_07437 [Morchella importuna]KAH8148336.1 hypothetical protein LAJ45_07437 [Morchella importuna]
MYAADSIATSICVTQLTKADPSPYRFRHLQPFNCVVKLKLSYGTALIHLDQRTPFGVVAPIQIRYDNTTTTTSFLLSLLRLLTFSSTTGTASKRLAAAFIEYIAVNYINPLN